MDSSRAAVLAVATILGLLVLAQSDGARASAISLRPRSPTTVEPRCSGAAPSAAPATAAARSASIKPALENK